MKTEQTSTNNLAAFEGSFNLNGAFVHSNEDYLTDIQTMAMESWSKVEFQELNNTVHAAFRSRPYNTNNNVGSLRSFIYGDARFWITKISQHYVDFFLCIRQCYENSRGVPYYLPRVTKLHTIDVAVLPRVVRTTDEGSFGAALARLETSTFYVVPVPMRLYLDNGRVSIRPCKGDAKTGIGRKTKSEMFDILFACLATLRVTKYIQRSRRKVYDLVRIAALCTGFTRVLTSVEVGSERAEWASIFDTLLFHRLMEQDWAVELFHSQST